MTGVYLGVGRSIMDTIRRITFGFAIVLGVVTSLNYIPGLTDAQGRTFGIFQLNLFNDILHGGSTLWALFAATRSRAASLGFLKAFGTLYFLDGLMGVFVGSGYLDLGIFLKGVLDQPLSFKILASAPHLILGGAAMVAGFIIAKRV
jgi:hypothetical protein